MTKIFDLIPSWIYAAVIAVLVLAVMGQRVQVSNAKAATARSAKDLSDYKLSASETTRILQAANDRKAEAQLAQQLEAQNAAKTREAALRDDAGNAVAELDRLRSALHVATRGTPMPKSAAAAGPDQSETIRGLLAECAAEYQSMGQRADIDASDKMTLIESWPK